MSPSALDYLRHIRDEARYLVDHVRGTDRADFLQDETMRRAFVRSLEIIGEATKKVPENIKTKYPEIEWRAMTGMRDKLIHDYFGVDYELVWDVALEKIPAMLARIEEILEREIE